MPKESRLIYDRDTKRLVALLMEALPAVEGNRLIRRIIHSAETERKLPAISKRQETQSGLILAQIQSALNKRNPKSTAQLTARNF